MNLVKGQKADITKGQQNLTTIKIGLGWDMSNDTSYDLDASVLLLDSTGKISSSKDIVFYNNLSADNNNIALSKDNRTGKGDGDDEEILINLKSVSSTIQKMIICITIHNASKNQQHFGLISNAYARVVDASNNKEIFRYSLPNEYEHKTALILGDVYKRNGEWRFSAVGRGLECDLANLCADHSAINLPENFFIKKDVKQQKSTINIKKIELKKSGDSINLNKTSDSLGKLTVNLNWNQPKQQNQKPKGFLSSLFGNKPQAIRTSDIDLDLGCFYELKTGSKGVVQALGRKFGSYSHFPFIELDSDDRTGSNKNGENLSINGDMISKFRRILVFAYIYEGALNWSKVDGVVTLKTENGNEITVRMDEAKNGLSMCSIALFENLDDKTFKVQKVVKYFSGHISMDKHFRWGLRWRYGSK